MEPIKVAVAIEESLRAAVSAERDAMGVRCVPSGSSFVVACLRSLTYHPRSCQRIGMMILHSCFPPRLLRMRQYAPVFRLAPLLRA